VEDHPLGSTVRFYVDPKTPKKPSKDPPSLKAEPYLRLMFFSLVAGVIGYACHRRAVVLAHRGRKLGEDVPWTLERIARSLAGRAVAIAAFVLAISNIVHFFAH
jgi:hypothetical protein